MTSVGDGRDAADGDTEPLHGVGRSGPLAVVAFGGNALLRSEDDGSVASQLARAEEAARWLGELAENGQLVLVHGNGPQVGQIMIQMEAASDKVPPGTLDVAVAETQGSMGYLLDIALRNRFAADGITGEPGTLLSLVVVDGDDPAFEERTKPVGPHFPAASARTLMHDHGWDMREQDGGGWRKMVSSPRPTEILSIELVRRLLDCSRVVIAAGGGGVPVVRRDGGGYRGVEAVIDKDRTASLLARELGADLFLILTNVPQVVKDFGTPDEEPLGLVPLAEARRLLDDGQFPAGSMGPKIEAAIEFVAATGRPVVITDIDHVHDAVAGRAGTRLVPDDPND